MLLLAPSREGLVAPNPVVAWLATLREPPWDPPFSRQEVPAGLVACLSLIEKWVLLGPVARGPGLLFSSFVAEPTPTELSGIGRSPQLPLSEPI